MNKQELKSLDKDTRKFINQLKEVGVKDSTIELVLRDICEYSEEQLKKQLEQMQKKFLELLGDK